MLRPACRQASHAGLSCQANKRLLCLVGVNPNPRSWTVKAKETRDTLVFCVEEHT